MNSPTVRQRPGNSDHRAAPPGNAVIRFSPCAPQQHETFPARRELPPELTYGCVDWFDYKNHPLKDTAGAARVNEAATPRDTPQPAEELRQLG